SVLDITKPNPKARSKQLIVIKTPSANRIDLTENESLFFLLQYIHAYTPIAA
ncbi:MAG: hypothetical protein RLZZ337_978, partial [Bacteroidota bacterium]